MAIELKCSTHAKERIKERMNIQDKRQIKELTRKAYHNGMCMKKHYFPKGLLRWIDYKVNQSYFGRCSQFRVYQNYLFLFSKNLTLVTVLEIPQKLQVKKSIDELKRW